MKIRALIILAILLMFSILIPPLFEKEEKLPEWLTLEHRQKIKD